MTIEQKPAPGSSQQVEGIIHVLHTLYPQARYELDFTTPLELFIATQLAAQCTDERVNAVTKELFQKYRSAQDYVAVSQEELEQDVKPTGFYRKKAAQYAQKLRIPPHHHNGEVPATHGRDGQDTRSGTQNSECHFGKCLWIVDGVIVDTHVASSGSTYWLVTHRRCQ